MVNIKHVSKALLTRIKCRDLRTKSQKEMLKLLEDHKYELSRLKVAQVTRASASETCKLRVIRKAIARVMIVMHEKRKENLRKLYKDEKLKPLDLRRKKTRAIRRRLNKRERDTKTKEQIRKLSAFPLRMYAIIA